MQGILLIIIGLLLAFLGLWQLMPAGALNTTTSSNWQVFLNMVAGFATLLIAIFTVVVAFANLRLSKDTRSSLEFARKANERLEKVFIAEIKPLICVVPRGIHITQEEKGRFAALTMDVVNYSGFDASKIYLDVKYGEGEWVSEWLTAFENSRQSQKNDEKTGEISSSDEDKKKAEVYSLSKFSIKQLKAGEKGQFFSRGQVPADDTAFSGEKFLVRVRVKWETEKGHLSDEVYDYILLCTAVGSGKSYTLIPKTTGAEKDRVHSSRGPSESGPSTSLPEKPR